MPALTAAWTPRAHRRASRLIGACVSDSPPVSSASTTRREARPSARANHPAATSPTIPAGTSTSERANVSTCHEPTCSELQR